MLGFDNCCCGCVQWEQDFTLEKNVDNWTIESGTYSLTDYGLQSTSADFVMLCSRECSNDIAYVDATYNFNAYSSWQPNSRGIKVGDWTVQATSSYLHTDTIFDGDGVTRGIAYCPRSAYAPELNYRIMRFYADGDNVSSGRAYVPGVPNGKDIRILFDNASIAYAYLTKVTLYRKEASGVTCQSLLSLASNRLTPLKVQAEISGIAAGSSPGNYPTTGLNGTYLTANLTGQGYATLSGTTQWWPCAWSIASTTTAGGSTYDITTTVTANPDGGIACTQNVNRSGTSLWTLQWTGTAGTDLDSLTGMSGLALSSPTVTYEHYSVSGLVNGTILSLGSTVCSLTGVL